MKLLLDACVWGTVAAELRAAGLDVVWAGDGPAVDDAELLTRGLAEGRLLVTVDEDLAEGAEFTGVRHHGILRLVNFPVRRQADTILAVLPRHAEELFKGATATVRERTADTKPTSPWKIG